MIFKWYGGDFLRSERQTDQKRADASQMEPRNRAVVVPPAIAETMQAGIETGKRHDDKLRNHLLGAVRRTERSETCRNQRIAMTPLAEKNGLVVGDDRQRDHDAALPQSFEKRPAIHFGSNRPITGNDARSPLLDQLRRRRTNNRRRLGARPRTYRVSAHERFATQRRFG